MKTLDKIITGLTIIAIIALTLSGFCAVAFGNQHESKLYPQTMKVIEIEDNIVTIQDYNGFIYEFEGAEDWEVGDICSCIMNDNGTPKIYDDEIVSIRYAGTFEEWH